MSFSAGTFSINTTGQPVVAGTTISASVFNAFTSDIATGLSTCMLKDGTQTATAGIGFYAGTVSLPGIYFGTDTATGFYRIGLNNYGYAVNGTKLLDMTGTTLAITSTVTANTIGVTSGTTATVFNTTATTVNAFGAASVALNVGHASGTNTILGATTFSQGMNGVVGGGTPAAGSFTTLGASGQITQTGAATGNVLGILLDGTTTGAHYAQVTNTTGNAIFGVDNSTANGIGITGGSNYGTVVGSAGNTKVHLIANSVTGLTLDPTGNAITMPSLAGSGTRAVVVDANGKLSAP